MSLNFLSSRMIDLQQSGWHTIASATHVVLRVNNYVPDRLMVCRHQDGRLLACAEIHRDDSTAAVVCEGPNDNFADLVAGVNRLAKRFCFPSWAALRCLIWLD